MSNFDAFPKIPRLHRACVITEKIDGTNAQIHIVRPEAAGADVYEQAARAVAANRESGLLMFAGSRARYITPTDDNFGFAAWVKANADALWSLGEGRHYGEWWGSGIQRGYGLQKGDKRFSLFNTGRWAEAGRPDGLGLLPDDKHDVAPACCRVVPVLYAGAFLTSTVDSCVFNLREYGSKAAPGFMEPEGVIVFHAAASQMFKVTLDGDGQPKSRAA